MSCCGQNYDWYVANECNDKVTDEINGANSKRNFCTYSVNESSQIQDKANIFRTQFCNSIGTGNVDDTSGEWIVSSKKDSCKANNAEYRTIWDPSGCSAGECCGTITADCPYAGNSGGCKRKGFLADPLTCCFRDYVGCNHIDINYCFENSTQKYTCDPNYRNQSGPGCQDRLTQYCLGVGDYPASTQEFINRWLSSTVNYDGVVYDKPCYYAVYRNMFTPDSTGCVKPAVYTGVVDNYGFIYAQNLVNAMIQKYLDNGGNLAATESSEYNTQLNSMIWDICSNNPGLCQNSLFKYCATVNTTIIQQNPQLESWCGCYMPAEQYSKYTELYGIQRQCTPTCNMSGTIALQSNDGVSKKTCSQSTCVIDDVSINIANSMVGYNEGINFTQLCNSCSAGGATCNCIITDTNITIINSTIGNLSVEQQCSLDSICYDDSSGVPIQVPCDGSQYNPYADIEAESEQNKQTAIRNRNLKILFLFIIVIALIIIFWYIYYPTKKLPNKVLDTKDLNIKPLLPMMTNIDINNNMNVYTNTNNNIYNNKLYNSNKLDYYKINESKSSFGDDIGASSLNKESYSDSIGSLDLSNINIENKVYI